MSGAALLSNAILESGEPHILSWLFTGYLLGSDSTVIRPNSDLTVQLNSRKEKGSFLIKFINENGVIGKVRAVCVHPAGLFSKMFRRYLNAAANALQRMQRSFMLLNSCGFV
jgi:hypothetical protein